MIHKLNSELAEAIASSRDGVIQIEAEDGSRFWLMTEAAIKTRDQVLKGLEELDRGESIPWDAEAIKAEGRQRLHGRKE